jgi:hypothetical protein
MSTPSYLAHLATGPRRHALNMLERTRLSEAVQTTAHERVAARKNLHQLNHAIDRVRAEQEKLNRHSLLYPPSPDFETERTRLADRYAQLLREHLHATALLAAADVVATSVVRERAWMDRPDPDKSGDGRLLANVVPVPARRFVNAPGYTVTVLHPDPSSKPLVWREVHHSRVRRNRAQSMLTAWEAQEQAYVLRDLHGRFYVATPTVRLELIPTDIGRPQTEGDALRAALAAYGFPGYDDTEGGFTWVSVPFHPDVSNEDTYTVTHFRVSSGEHADRFASRHDDVWGASLYNEDGAYVTTLDGAPAGSTLAEDCAHIARAIAEFTGQINA